MAGYRDRQTGSLKPVSDERNYRCIMSVGQRMARHIESIPLEEIDRRTHERPDRPVSLRDFPRPIDSGRRFCPETGPQEARGEWTGPCFDLGGIITMP